MIEVDLADNREPHVEQMPGDYRAGQRRRAYLDCVRPVLERDKRLCVYCGGRGTGIDQFTDGEPSLDTLVACCTTCHYFGRGRLFPTFNERASWVAAQRERLTINEAAEEFAILRRTLSRWIASGRLRSFPSEEDSRVKHVIRGDLAHFIAMRESIE